MTEVTSPRYSSGYMKVMKAFSFSQRLNSHYNMGTRHRNQYLNPNIKRLERMYGFVDRPQTSTAEIRKPEFLNLNHTANSKQRPRSANLMTLYDKNLLSSFQPVYTIKKTLHQEIVPYVNKSKKRRPASASYGRKSINIVIPISDSIDGLCIDTTKSCMNRFSQPKFEEFNSTITEAIEVSRTTEETCPLFGMNVLVNDVDHILGSCSCHKCICGYHTCPASVVPAVNNQLTFMTEFKGDYIRRSPSSKGRMKDSKLASKRSESLSPNLLLPEPKIQHNIITPTSLRPQIQYIRLPEDSSSRIETEQSGKETPFALKPTYKNELAQTLSIEFPNSLDIRSPIDNWFTKITLKEPSYVTGSAKYIRKCPRPKTKVAIKPRVPKKSSNTQISLSVKSNSLNRRKTMGDAKLAFL